MIPHVRDSIDSKVRQIAGIRPNDDPAVAPWARHVAATVRAVQAYEGALIAQVLPAVLAQAPHLNVASQVRITLPRRAFEAVEQGATDVALECAGDGPVRQCDFVSVDSRTGRIEFVECKRGLHQIGADHQRARLKDDAVLELIGRSYARHGFRQIVTASRALTVSYYGNTGLPEDRTLRAAELDDHYGWPVRDAVEAHLAYFRARLNWAIPGLTGVAG